MAQDLRRQIDAAAAAGRKVLPALCASCGVLNSCVMCTCPLHQQLCVRARCTKKWPNSVCLLHEAAEDAPESQPGTARCSTQGMRKPRC